MHLTLNISIYWNTSTENYLWIDLSNYWFSGQTSTSNRWNGGYWTETKAISCFGFYLRVWRSILLTFHSSLFIWCRMHYSHFACRFQFSKNLHLEIRSWNPFSMKQLFEALNKQCNLFLSWVRIMVNRQYAVNPFRIFFFFKNCSNFFLLPFCLVLFRLLPYAHRCTLFVCNGWTLKWNRKQISLK